MAMNFSNYGYRAPSNRTPSPQFSSSTPTNSRFLMPRFGYSSIPQYPRPRSSASKPNPGSFSEDSVLDSRMDFEYPALATRDQFENSNSNMNSMRNNFGSPNAHMADSYVFSDELYSNRNSLQSPDSSAYYSCNSTFSESPRFSPVGTLDRLNGNTDRFQKSDPSTIDLRSESFSLGLSLSKEISKFASSERFKFQHSSNGRAKQFFPKKINPINPEERPKIKKAIKKAWRCTLCATDFTSSNPYEWHLRGAKHAKKMKTKNVLKSIQKQVAESKYIARVTDKTFRCDLCNILANSSLQLQMHLSGTKHKAKVQQAEGAKEKKDETMPEAESSEVNGKSDGSTVRSLPSDFGEPQPAKLFKSSAKYSCDICELILNSDVQLQQHLTGKYHQAKVEGKPLEKKKFQKKKETEQTAEQSSPSGEGNTSEAPKTEESETVAPNAEVPVETKTVAPNAVAPVETKTVAPNAVVPVETKTVAPNAEAPVETKTVAPKTVEAPVETKTVAPETVETKTVVGVKNLSSSFVQGETKK